jgi:hypothetical protein
VLAADRWTVTPVIGVGPPLRGGLTAWPGVSPGSGAGATVVRGDGVRVAERWRGGWELTALPGVWFGWPGGTTAGGVGVSALVGWGGAVGVGAARRVAGFVWAADRCTGTAGIGGWPPIAGELTALPGAWPGPGVGSVCAAGAGAVRDDGVCAAERWTTAEELTAWPGGVAAGGVGVSALVGVAGRPGDIAGVRGALAAERWTPGRGDRALAAPSGPALFVAGVGVGPPASGGLTARPGVSTVAGTTVVRGDGIRAAERWTIGRGLTAWLEGAAGGGVGVLALVGSAGGWGGAVGVGAARRVAEFVWAADRWTGTAGTWGGSPVSGELTAWPEGAASGGVGVPGLVGWAGRRGDAAGVRGALAAVRWTAVRGDRALAAPSGAAPGSGEGCCPVDAAAARRCDTTGVSAATRWTVVPWPGEISPVRERTGDAGEVSRAARRCAEPVTGAARSAASGVGARAGGGGGVLPPPTGCSGVGSGRYAGRRRRCTGGASGPAALVKERGASGRCGGAGVTRRPDAGEGAGGRTARTGPGAGGTGASVGAGITTGSVNDGCSSPWTGRPCAVGRSSLARLMERPSRTAWDSVPAKEGFWNVAIRPVNPGSATPRPPFIARWIGGRPVQATGTAGRADGGVPAPAPASASWPPAVRLRPLNLSRSATAQSSDPARVTRDAICSA